ncbi:MAG: YbbR-like domain-containing protein [Bacteroidaceae bacterium]|nr:YbbR-like domain-containing protein [Bacteroidaceae bacterium]
MAKNKPNYKQIKEKLFGPKSHELLVFCFFLVVSFGFWLLQALHETLDRDVNVSVELENVPEDVIIIDSLPSSINVTLRDRGLTLARHSISSIFRPNRIKIDFASYDTGLDEAEVYITSGDIQRMLRRVFAASTKVQSIRPDTLRFAFNHGLSQNFPVILTGAIKAAPQKYIQAVNITPDSVRVYAPKAILDTMHAVYTDVFTLNEVQKSGNYQAALRKQKFIKYEPYQVRIGVDVGYYTDKTIKDVPIIGLNFPAEKRLRTFPSQVAVTFTVESGLYDKITSKDLVLATTYEELLQNKEDSMLHLQLKNIPNGISNVRISPSKVDYLIEQVAAEED